MTAAAVTIAAIVAGFIALGWAIGRLERRLRRPQHGWDWPEDEHPSLGGWADREQL